MIKVVGIEDRTLGRRKHKFLGDVVFPFEISLQEPCIPKFEQRAAQLTGHIDPAGFFTLGGRMLTEHIVVGYDDEAIAVLFILAELNVSPLKRNQFAAPQAGTQSHHEKGMIFRANFHGREKEVLRFRGGQGNSFLVGRFRRTSEPSQPRSRVGFDEFILNCLVEHTANDTKDVSNCAA